MSKQNETIADIVEEMRHETSDSCVWSIFDSTIRRWAERLDAAWKRDILVEAKRNQDVVDGLTAECDRLREALETVGRILHGDNPFGVRAIVDMELVVSAALSAQKDGQGAETQEER